MGMADAVVEVRNFALHYSDSGIPYVLLGDYAA
jgi:hypothetical protein